MDSKLLAGFIALIVALISFGSYSGIGSITGGSTLGVGSSVSLVATFITLIIALVMFAKYFKVIK
jgi:hypothetical protein